MHRVRRTTILWALEPPTCVLWTCWAVRKTTFIAVGEKWAEGFAEYDTLQVLIAQLLGVSCWLKVPLHVSFVGEDTEGLEGLWTLNIVSEKEVSDPDGLKKRNSWQLGHFLASACNENNDHSGVSLHFWFLIADQPKPVWWHFCNVSVWWDHQWTRKSLVLMEETRFHVCCSFSAFD